MRRSSFVQLTLLPMLASARLLHADPDPAPTGAPGYGGGDPPVQVAGNPSGGGQPQPYSSTYIGPDGTVVLMPPGLTEVIPIQVPCEQDPDQPQCKVTVAPQVYWQGTFRGGFGGFFGGHIGFGGHGG